MAKLEDVLSLIEFNIPDGKKFEDLSNDEIKEHFEKNFVGVNVATERDEIKNKILGKHKGSLATELKNKFEELGVSFEGKQIKENDRIMLDKVLEFGFGDSVNLLKTLKESANKTDDKKLNDTLAKLEKMQADYSTVLSERDGLKKAVDEKDSMFETFKKQTTLNEKIKQAKSGIPFSETASEFARKGFDVAFAEKYDIELSDTNDSEDGLRIVSKATKQRVSEGNKFMTFEQLYKKELAEAKLLKVAQSNGQTQPQRQTWQQPQNGDGKELKINPLAKMIAEGQKI